MGQAQRQSGSTSGRSPAGVSPYHFWVFPRGEFEHSNPVTHKSRVCRLLTLASVAAERGPVRGRREGRVGLEALCILGHSGSSSPSQLRSHGDPPPSWLGAQSVDMDVPFHRLLRALCFAFLLVVWPSKTARGKHAGASECHSAGRP